MTTGDPSQGKDTENCGVAEKKQQEACWSSRNQCTHNPNLLHHHTPHQMDWVGLSATRAKIGQAETRKEGDDTGNVLVLAWGRGRKKAYLHVCLIIYVLFLPVPESVIKCFGV